MAERHHVPNVIGLALCDASSNTRTRVNHRALLAASQPARDGKNNAHQLAEERLGTHHAREIDAIEKALDFWDARARGHRLDYHADGSDRHES